MSNKTKRATATNGSPMIVLNPGARWVFQFGADKARMIVDCFEEIKAFAQEQAAKSQWAVFYTKGTAKGEIVCNDEASAIAQYNELQGLGFSCSEPKPYRNGSTATAPKYSQGPRNNCGQGA